jgi:hypothetical protein
MGIGRPDSGTLCTLYTVGALRGRGKGNWGGLLWRGLDFGRAANSATAPHLQNQGRKVICKACCSSFNRHLLNRIGHVPTCGLKITDFLCSRLLMFAYLRLCSTVFRPTTFGRALRITIPACQDPCPLHQHRGASFIRPLTSPPTRPTIYLISTATAARRSYSAEPANMAIDFDTVLKGKYPAKAHAKRVVEYIRTKLPDASGTIYLEGRPDALLEDSDEPVPFRQRRAFMYLSGVDLPDCYLTYEIEKEHLTLFIPPIDPESVVWAGLPLTSEEALAKYDVDAVLPNTELNATLAKLGNENKGTKSNVFAIADRVADHVTFLEFDSKNLTILGEAIDECRVIKDEYEIALIRKANVVSGAAHRAVFEHVKQAKNEYELEGVFLGECNKMGAKKQAYPSIVASGRDAATLHYVHNNRALYSDGVAKDLLLVDAGAEWDCYSADIVSTWDERKLRFRD